MKRLAVSVLVLSAVMAQSALARVIEDQVDLPVEVKDAYGKTLQHKIRVTVFSDLEAQGFKAPSGRGN